MTRALPRGGPYPRRVGRVHPPTWACPKCSATFGDYADAKRHCRPVADRRCARCAGPSVGVHCVHCKRLLRGLAACDELDAIFAAGGGAA